MRMRTPSAAFIALAATAATAALGQAFVPYVSPWVIGTRAVHAGVPADVLDCSSGSIRLVGGSEPAPRKGGCRGTVMNARFHQVVLPLLDQTVRQLVPSAAPTDAVTLVHWRTYGDTLVAGSRSISLHAAARALDLHELRLGGEVFNYERAATAYAQAIEAYVNAHLPAGQATFDDNELGRLMSGFSRDYSGGVGSALEYVEVWQQIERRLDSAGLYTIANSPAFAETAKDSGIYTRKLLVLPASKRTELHWNHMHVSLPFDGRDPEGTIPSDVDDFARGFR